MSDAQPVELSIERSNDAEQPFILRTYDTRGTGRKKIAYSETYRQKASARNAAEAIKAGRVRYSTFKGQDGQYRWHVKGGNGETMALSAYKWLTEPPAAAEMNWLKANAHLASIVDHAG